MCEECVVTVREEETAGSISLELEKLFEDSKSVECFSVDAPPNRNVVSTHGIVFGVSSKQAFWGLSTQSNRLTRAFEVALVDLKVETVSAGGNAVIGISFALNNSTGSAAMGITGSSEAVMLIGTAVTLDNVE
jgi:uncharacterized protein YbjQ (UPF0145 family)